MNENICEKCSMVATYLKADESGLVHYYCDHHKPFDSHKIGGVMSENRFNKFLPIIIIFSIIILFTFITTYVHGFSIEFAMRMMMGSFFAIFGAFKISNLKAFADAYSTYDVLAIRSRLYAYIYPFIELMLAILYLKDIGGIYRDVFTLIIMVVSSIGVIIKLKNKEEIPCACLGMVFKIPMTWVTLIEDLLMAVEAIIMIGLFINK